MLLHTLFAALKYRGPRASARRKLAQLRSRRPWTEQLEDRLVPATLTVTGPGDDIAVDGFVTLREAITSANNNANVNVDVSAIGAYGTDTITFNIQGAGVKTITPSAPGLPAITDPVIIDGYTQPGASANTLAVGNNAVLLIELNGTSAGGSGLALTGGGSTIRGLVINRFGGQFDDGGILLSSDNNVVEGNIIGLDSPGNAELGNSIGVRVTTGRNNLIGGTTPAARNVISGNGLGQGALGNVVVSKVTFAADPPPTGTLIQGNYIGTNAAGTVATHPGVNGNSMGVFVLDSRGTIIGGSDADDGSLDGNVGARNVISGNVYGIVTEEIGTNYPADLTVQGNFIGVDATGISTIGNFQDGIFFSPQRNRGDNKITIGGAAAGAGNVISGNIGNGVLISDSNVLMQGNRIGTDLAGTLDLGNGFNGVQLTRGGSPPFPSLQFTVGGTTPEARNIISGNGSAGLVLNNLSGLTTVQGNYIGTQSDGQSPLGNGTDGIVVTGEPATIGGIDPGAGNVIAFNGGKAVSVATVSSPILGNSIFANTGLGIDLGSDGVTPNDNLDADVGPNNLQNFPVLSTVTTASSTTTIVGSLSSTPNGTFRIEFFANDVAGPSGFGEGQTYLGFKNVTTDASGTATFTATTAADGVLPIPAGKGFVAATATDDSGNTSEFSKIIIASTALVAQFSLASFSVNENSGTAVITVTRTGDPAVAFTVDFSTSDATATAGSDYTANSGTLSFAAGEMSKSFNIAILDDTAVEGDETVNLVLQNPTGGALLGAPATAILTIIDNDRAQPAGQLAFSAPTFSVGEGGGNATITVTRTGGSAGAVSVSVNSSDGSAASGLDYTATSLQVTWADGDAATKTITIRIVQDSLVEGNETVNLGLSTPTGGAALGAQSAAVLTIVDDDSSPPVKGSISGRVVYDYNANGVENHGEPPLAGMTIFLDTDNDGQLDAGEAKFVTGANGQYTFANLDPGNYVVRQDFVPNHGIVLTSAPALTLTLSGGANLTGENFANVLISQVSPVEVAADRFPVSPDIETAYVHGLYVNVLHREPEPGGLSGWVGLLKSRSNTLVARQEVVNQFWQSPEHRGLQVDQFYATYLHRAAEAEGRAFHVQQFLNHASEADVVNGFLQSAEYQNAHSADGAFVAGLFADVLSRPAQVGEVAAGVQRLHSESRSDFARGLIESDESYLRIVDSYYVVYLHRPAEEGGRNFWLNLLRGSQAAEEVSNAISDNSPGGVAMQFLSGDVRIQEYIRTAQESVR